MLTSWIVLRVDGSLPLTQAVWTIIACAAIAALWAVFRPDLVRDNEGRRLPSSITARLTFTILFVFGYLGLAAAFLFGGIFVQSIINHLAPAVFRGFDNEAFVFALFATFGLYSFAPFREIERNVLAWMHDTGHLRGDVQALAVHLQECSFNISAGEQKRNLKSLEALEVYITDTDTRGINLESVIARRKTASLLRYVREWNAAEPRVLSQEEMAVLSELEGAHARKTRLTADIIRILDAKHDSSDATGSLSAVHDMLAKAQHGNLTGVAEIEEKARAKLEANPISGGRQRPVRISSTRLREYLEEIEDYFAVEYRLLLERIARLAAKSVVHAGDLADGRLEELKEMGFEGLGSIRPLSAHRVLWLFLSVAIGGFLIYYVLWYDTVLQRMRDLAGSNLSQAQIDGVGQTLLISIFFFVTTIAFAALFGALFGSSSSNARGKETSWGRYLGAGMMAVAVFFGLQLIREAVIHATDLSEMLALMQPKGQTTSWDIRIRSSAPWAVLPFFITVVICWLARQRPWQPSRALGESTTATLQRILDGLVVGFLMVPSYVLATGLLQMVKIPRPILLNTWYDPPVIAILGILGFLVGAVVVRDVRTAAHTQVVAPAPRRAAPQRGRATMAQPEY